VKIELTLPDKIDPSDHMSWQYFLYSKLGSHKLAIKGNQLALVEKHVKDHLVERIIDMAKVLYGLHVVLFNSF